MLEHFVCSFWADFSKLILNFDLLVLFPFLNTDYGGYHKVNECPVCWSVKGMKRTPSFGSVASLSRNKNIDGSWVCDHRVKKKLDKHNLVVTTRITSLFPELNSVKPLWIALLLGGPTQPPQACRRSCRPRWPGVPVVTALTVTPWKINGWSLQITRLERNMIWTITSMMMMFQPLVFRGVFLLTMGQKKK